MIVPKTTVQSILSGRVTQLWQPTTRWTPKRTDRLRSAHLERDQDNPDKVIRRWAGTEPFARVKITRYEQVMLDDLTDRDAKTGGYSDVGHMMREWFDAFGLAWTGQAAWQLGFEIDLSEPANLLAAVSGYTSSVVQALPEEPEAVSQTVLAQFAAENDVRWRASHGDEVAKRELNRLGRSVREEGLRAIRAGCDVSGNLERIQAELDQIRQNREAA